MLVGVITQQQNEKKSKEYLDELAFLVETAGASPVKRFTQKVSNPNPKTFIGSGKINEIASYVDMNDVDLVIFDDELSPSQLRNIEAVFGERKILIERI